MLLHALLESIRQRSYRESGRPALKYGGATWTFFDLWHSAKKTAEQITALGARPGYPVCVRAKKSPDALAVILGCGLAGVPVLLVSVDLGQDSLDSLLARTGSTHVVSVSGTGRPGSPVSLQCKETGLSEVAGEQRERLAGAPLVLTTSGSTGVPKLVPLSGPGVERFFGWASDTFEITAESTVLSYAPLNFDLSLLDIWTTLSAGGCAVLVDHERATDADYLTELLTAHPVEVIQAVPLFFRLLAERGGCFPSVRHVVSTGDMLPPSLLARFPEVFPNAKAYNVYGCTETNDSLVHEFTGFALPADARLPVGRPIEGVFTELVDRDGQVVVGEGTGELLVSTPFQTDGYLDAELTAERFVTRTSAGVTRVCYRTGDVVRRDGSGLLFLEGRDDFQVKVRGVRTNLQEIEHVLEQHPDVVEASVVALPDELAGCRLHAALRTGSGRRLNSLQLRSHCSAALPRTAIPSSFDIRVEPLPRTSTGKIDRHLIRAQHQSSGE